MHRSSVKRYLDDFDQMRILQDYLIDKAKKYHVPVFDNVNMENTLNSISAHILLRA